MQLIHCTFCVEVDADCAGDWFMSADFGFILSHSCHRFSNFCQCRARQWVLSCGLKPPSGHLEVS